MPKTILLVNQRLVILKMLLDIMRVYCSAHFNGKHFGSCANDFLLCAAVLVGQAEGHPLNASKLSAFTGIPRPTVIRKMAAFERAGRVVRNGGTFALRTEAINSREAQEAVRFSTNAIVIAAGKLSKLDTKGVAAPSSLAVWILQMIFDEGVAEAMNTCVLLTRLHG